MISDLNLNGSQLLKQTLCERLINRQGLGAFFQKTTVLMNPYDSSLLKVMYPIPIISQD